MKKHKILFILFCTAMLSQNCLAYTEKEKALACVALISASINELQTKIAALKDDLFDLGDIKEDITKEQSTKVNLVFNKIKLALFSPTFVSSVPDYKKTMKSDELIAKGLELAAKK